MKNALINHWKLYEEPQLDEQGQLMNRVSLAKPQTQNDSDSEEVPEGNQEQDIRLEMPLPEGCLKVNLGIPILVVVNKVDLVLHGDKKAFLD